MPSKEWRNNGNISNISSVSKDFNIETLINNKTILTSNDGFTLIWYDASVNKDEQDDQYTLSQLYLITRSIIIFTHEQKCLEFISQCYFKYKLILIISGSLGQNFVPKIYHLTQIYSIYIFCGRKTVHEIWAKKYSKIKGTFDEITELCKCLKYDKDKFELDQMCQAIVDVFPKKFSSFYQSDELINLEIFGHDDYNQPKDDMKIDITSVDVPFSKKETFSSIKEEEIDYVIQPSETVAPYMHYKQQMEFSDTGIWPCVSIVDSTRNELVNHIHSVLDAVKYFPTVENFLQDLHNHPIDPHLIIISNPVSAEQLSKLIHQRIQRVFIYCSNTRLNEYDAWSKKYPNIVFVLQHFHTLIRLILWELSACIVNIGNYYDRQKKTDLAQARYRYAYRLHVIIRSALNNRIEMIDYNQSTKLDN